MSIKCVLHSVCVHTRLGSVGECVSWLCVQACAKHAHTQVQVEQRSDTETVFLPFYTATRHAFSHYNPFSEVFLFYFARGEREIFCNHVQRSHMFLSRVLCFPTKCSTSPAVIPGCGLHTISSLLCSPSAQRVWIFWQLLLAVGALLWFSVPCLAGHLQLEM